MASSLHIGSAQLLDLLLKATRTSDARDAIRWWDCFYETLQPHHSKVEGPSDNSASLLLGNEQSALANRTIRVLAKVLDKDNLSVLHYLAYYNNLVICRKLADEDCDFNTVGNRGETILHIAARSKAVDQAARRRESLLLYLLSEFRSNRKPLVNIDKRDDQGRTALHHAVMANRSANVKLLLEYQACIAAKDIRQATPLHYACRFNPTSTMVRYLLLRADWLGLESNKQKWMGRRATHHSWFPIRSKIDYINAQTKDGHDAFSLARTYNHEQVLEELFQHIPHDHVRWQEKAGSSIVNRIYKAIAADDLTILDPYPAWFVMNGKTGETVLHVACALGCSTTVLYLLERRRIDYYRVNPLRLREKQNGFTPLLTAAYAGHCKCFEILLTHILELRPIESDLFVDRFDRTLLHLAVLSRQPAILEILCFHIQIDPVLFIQMIEPMICALDYYDETPLHVAVRLKEYSLCSLLLQFSNQLDDIQQPCVYLDRIDGELIRSAAAACTKDVRFIPSMMLSMLTESHVYSIGCKNRKGRSPFHTAVVLGDQRTMNLFLRRVSAAGMKYLLEHTDADVRTPLHLACRKGRVEIVKQLFSLRVDLYARDAEESTPLHCVARCVDRNRQDSSSASADILNIFLQFILNCQHMSCDLLTTVDGYGHNCLETAILARNRPFVIYLLNLNNTSLFKNLLRNAQVLDSRRRHIDTPLRKLIMCMPDLAYRVLDMCITHIGNKHKAQYKIVYDFEFLEDHCYIPKWQHDATFQTPPKEPLHKWYCLLFCYHRRLQFQNQFHHNSLNEPLIAYTAEPHTLVHNSVLSVMCKCAKQIDLKYYEEEYADIQHTYKLMHHPLCTQLTQLKWRQFGLPLFLASFLIYCTYLILLTIIMLRNKQPEYFYRLVNATFPNSRYFNGTEMECEDVAKRLVKLNVHGAIKEPIDRILKICVVVLLWLQIGKGAWLIIGVHRCSLVWRLYLETIAFVLSFLCLYDDGHWQSRVKLRCSRQWQMGAFAVFLAWATLLSYLRFLPIFGVYVVMLEVIMLKFLWFAPVLVILICSFSSAFYMLLQNQPVFSTIPFAWFRSVFMVLDTGYEDRFFGPDSDAYISLYPVLFVLFLLFGVTMTILVNNLLTALAVGEIADLSAIARVRNATRRYELLREWEIFRLQCFRTPATLRLRHEHEEKQWDREMHALLKWIYRRTFLKAMD